MSELVLTRKIESLTIFRGLLDKEPLKSMREFAHVYEGNDSVEDTVSAYCKFVSVLYNMRYDGDISAAIWDALRDDENPYIKCAIENLIEAETEGEITNRKTNLLNLTTEKELDVLTEIGSFTSFDFKDRVFYDGYLPDFTSTYIDFKSRYMNMVQNISKTGYGKYSKSLMFKVVEGKIVPVKHPDPISTDDLFCYEMQREKVINNTKAFIDGKPAADILLYGDAGTGKSSTVKAVSRMFEKDGVRLVELPKKEINNLSTVIEKLSQVPMKFILFVDDLSFEATDERIGSLKSVLEGAASGHRRNILIYCTSNRRHMIKETFSDRSDEIHASDTIAEQMSLSERFGLRILFDKPNKFVFLDIVRNLAKARNIKIEDETLCAQAETYALRAGGRSARLARQFVDSLDC